MQCYTSSSAIRSQEFPLQQKCQSYLGQNLAAEAGGEIQFGLITKHITQDGAGYNIIFEHSYWIVTIPLARELP